MERRTRDELMARLHRDAVVLAERFGLRFRALEPERANVTSHYGICYSDGTIRIRLRHATTGRPLKYSSLVNTLCHELAHLRYFDHGLRFQQLYGQILEFARDHGIYVPRKARPAVARAAAPAPRAPARPPRTGPTQLSLFR